MWDNKEIKLLKQIEKLAIKGEVTLFFPFYLQYSTNQYYVGRQVFKKYGSGDRDGYCNE